MENETKTRREAIAAALTWKLAAPILRQRATYTNDYDAYRRQLNLINATVRSRVFQARLMGARIAY